MLSVFLCVALLGASAIAIPVDIDKSSASSEENPMYENCTFSKNKNETIELRKIFGLLDTDEDDILTYDEYCVLILSADDGEHTLPDGQTKITKEAFEGAWTTMMVAADIPRAKDKACAYMQKADNCSKASEYYQDGWLIIDTSPKGLEIKTGQDDEGRCVFNYMGGYALDLNGEPPKDESPPDVVNIADFCTNMKKVIMDTNTEGACTEEGNEVANNS